MSLRPQTISAGTSISRQPVAERVARARASSAPTKPGVPGAADELVGQRHGQPLRVAHDELQRQPAAAAAGVTTGSCCDAGPRRADGAADARERP